MQHVFDVLQITHKQHFFLNEGQYAPFTTRTNRLDKKTREEKQTKNNYGFIRFHHFKKEIRDRKS